MLKPFALLVIVVVAGCGGWSDFASPSAAPPHPDTTVIDLRVGAVGEETTVQAGESVAWRSADGMHHTAASSSTPQAFVEVDVPSGAVSAAVRFATPGDYPYFCSIHGVQNGTVHVIAVQ
jgi:plastocyanin